MAACGVTDGTQGPPAGEGEAGEGRHQRCPPGSDKTVSPNPRSPKSRADSAQFPGFLVGDASQPGIVTYSLGPPRAACPHVLRWPPHGLEPSRLHPSPNWGSPLSFSLHQGDALSVLATLPDGCADSVITDPPYNSGGRTAKERTSRSARQKYVSADAQHALPDFVGENMDQRSYTLWLTQIMTEAHRATKVGGTALLFTDWRQLPSDHGRAPGRWLAVAGCPDLAQAAGQAAEG